MIFVYYTNMSYINKYNILLLYVQVNLPIEPGRPNQENIRNKKIL